MGGETWRRLQRLYSGKLEKRRPNFFQVYLNLYECHLQRSKIILACYVTVIFLIKDYCSANLKFRAHK